jgi:hypothetical protein
MAVSSCNLTSWFLDHGLQLADHATALERMRVPASFRVCRRAKDEAGTVVRATTVPGGEIYKGDRSSDRSSPAAAAKSSRPLDELRKTTTPGRSWLRGSDATKTRCMLPPEGRPTTHYRHLLANSLTSGLLHALKQVGSHCDRQSVMHVLPCN